MSVPSLVPGIRLPFMALNTGVLSFQDGKCAHRELKAVECVEAYGFHQAEEKCRMLIEDFRECISNSRSITRVDILRSERLRQYRAGEREKLYDDLPRYDSA